MRRLATIPVLAALAMLAAVAPAAAVSPGQRRCLVELNRAGLRVADLEVAGMMRCARRALRGSLPPGQDLAACLAADPGGQVARARVTADVAEARWCEQRPPFGVRTAAAASAMLSPARQLAALFGEDPDAALASGDGRACRLAAVRAIGNLSRARLREFSTCAADGVASGAIDSSAGLAACIGSDGGGRVAREQARAARSLAAACAGAAAGTIVGRCTAVAPGDLAGCIEPEASCDACLGLNDAQRTAAPCHRFVDGVAVARCGPREHAGRSVALEWDEALLAAIRIDLPRPVVHSRNLFHLSVAMWDAWAAYDGVADPVVYAERAAADDVGAARNAAISFAAYRLLRHRFAGSVGASRTLPALDALLYDLGYDRTFTSTVGGSPAALGNRVAAAVIARGLGDGANEAADYADPTYAPLNAPLVVDQPGTAMLDPNRWQPLALAMQVGQNGVPIPGNVQVSIGSQWSAVLPFAIERPAPGLPYFSPDAPPAFGTASAADYVAQAVEVIARQALLDPDDPTVIDASPGAMGANSLGANDGTGHPSNPATGQPYAPNPVLRHDFYRVLASFWADGPASETPPGHWNAIANGVADSPGFERRIGGSGPVLDPLEWDVKVYLALNGAVHDAGIAAWEQKRLHDSARPISMIRHLAALGQSSDPGGASYGAAGLPIVPGLIEPITAESSAPGGRHEHLAGFVGELAVRGWRGEPADPRAQVGGVGWIRAARWVAYQRKTFVSPAFPGFVSGHSSFSRAAAEVLAAMTGSEWFPGGLGEFVAPADTFLPPERGPTVPVRVQYATYFDAADQAGASRLWGGIHIAADDLAGRRIGAAVGVVAWQEALRHFDGTATP